MNLDHDSVPIIKSDWILRNDGTYLVLYKLSFDELKHFVLPPTYASIIPLVNGKRTYREILESIVYTHSLNGIEEASTVFENMIAILNEDDKIITEKCSDSAQSNLLNMIDYCLDFDSYEDHPKRLHMPIFVSIAMTNNCERNCLYCYAERPKLSSRHLLSTRKWYGIIDELVQNKIFLVELGGGDPLSTRDSIDVILYLLESKVLFFLSTKCTIKPSLVNLLCEKGFNESVRGLHRQFQISIDSCVPEEADFLAGTTGYLNVATQSIKNLVRRGFNPRVKSVLTPYNYGSFRRTIEYFADLGVGSFQFVQYSRSYYRHRDDLFLTLDQKLWLHSEYEEIIHNIGNNLEIVYQDEYDSFDFYKRMNVDNWHSRNLCSGGFTSFCIMPNGDVILCDQIPHEEDYVFGNISNCSVREAWSNPKIDEFLFAPRSKFIGTACYDCNEFENCHYDIGYCYRDALFNYDTIFEAPSDCPYQTKPSRRMI